MADENTYELIAHPFRLAGSGAVATVTDGSDEAYAQAIAIHALTRRGERDLVPDFGIEDPTFDPDMDLADLNIGLALFGPPVTVTGIDITDQASDAVRVVVSFDVDGEDESNA